MSAHQEQEDKYRFTADWFANNTPVFTTLLSHLAGKSNLHFLEIGSYEGMSACWLMDTILTHSSSRITCIDGFWGEWEAVFDANIRISGRSDQVTKIKGKSEETLLALPRGTFDVAYIDGSHRAADVLFDAVVCFSLIKQGGVMIMDDYSWRDPANPKDNLLAPKIAIDAFLQIYADGLDVLHKGYAVAIRKKST